MRTMSRPGLGRQSRSSPPGSPWLLPSRVAPRASASTAPTTARTVNWSSTAPRSPTAPLDASGRSEAVIDEGPSAEGTLTDDRADVVWKADDEHLDHDKVGGSSAVVATDGVIRLADHSFAAMDDEEALRSHDGRC